MEDHDTIAPRMKKLCRRESAKAMLRKLVLIIENKKKYEELEGDRSADFKKIFIPV